MSWLSSLFKSQQTDDPLSGIRSQLSSLAGQVPGLVEKQKANIADIYGTAREEGLKGIGENVSAERGFGSTSIFDRLKTELMTKLAQGQSSEDLAAEQWGLGSQADILGRAGSLAAQEQPNQPSAISQILGGAAGLGANLLDQNWLQNNMFNRLQNMYSGGASGGAGKSGGGAYNPEMAGAGNWLDKIFQVAPAAISTASMLV